MLSKVSVANQSVPTMLSTVSVHTKGCYYPTVHSRVKIRIKTSADMTHFFPSSDRALRKTIKNFDLQGDCHFINNLFSKKLCNMAGQLHAE